MEGVVCTNVRVVFASQRLLRIASRLTFNPASPTDSVLHQRYALRLRGYTSGTRPR